MFSNEYNLKIPDYEISFQEWSISILLIFINNVLIKLIQSENSIRKHLISIRQIFKQMI